MIGKSFHSTTLPSFSVRSRFAQVGINLTSIKKVDERTYIGTFTNHGPRPVYVPVNTPLCTLFEPSIPASGEQLLNEVNQNLKIYQDDFIIADKSGNELWQPGQKHQFTDEYALLGIRTNPEEFYEVKPHDSNIVMPQDENVRVAVSQFLQPVESGMGQHSFAVTSTIPVSIGDIYMTLIPHHYDSLYHLNSVVIQPNSDWSRRGGNNSGIRCEFFSLNNEAVNSSALPDYVFFAIHSNNR